MRRSRAASSLRRLPRPPGPTRVQPAALPSPAPAPRRLRVSPGARPERYTCSLYSAPETSPAASAPRPPPSSGRPPGKRRDRVSKDLLHWLRGTSRSLKRHCLLAERRGACQHAGGGVNEGGAEGGVCDRWREASQPLRWSWGSSRIPNLKIIQRALGMLVSSNLRSPRKLAFACFNDLYLQCL